MKFQTVKQIHIFPKNETAKVPNLKLIVRKPCKSLGDFA